LVQIPPGLLFRKGITYGVWHCTNRCWSISEKGALKVLRVPLCLRPVNHKVSQNTHEGSQRKIF
jgi:hypothetical protein